MIDALGQDVTFWILAALCVASWVFVHRLVPETKGRSLEETSADLGTSEPETAGPPPERPGGLTPPGAPATA